jgi:hypothetical protein
MHRRWLRVLLVLIFLTLLDSSVNAEWVALGDRYQSHPLQTVYIDLGSIHRASNVVMISALIDWKMMQGGRTPTRFSSTTLTKQFDCIDKRFRTLASTDYVDHMGMGEIIGGGKHTSEDQWVAVAPGTINEGLLKAACGTE